jgi:hypothetical protein
MDDSVANGERRGAGRLFSGALRRSAFWLCLAALIVVQLSLTAYFLKPKLIFDSQPLSWLDYDTHIEQTWRVAEALDRWGKTWLYDPYLLAGYPNGAIFDADNKGWELWTYALSSLGLPRAVAFDLFILLIHLLAPWALFAAAKAFGLDRWGALTAGSLGLCLWFFDAFPRWCWWIGMISWGGAALLAPLAIALMYRFLRDGRPIHAAIGGIVLAVGHLIHPYIFVVVAIPMLALYIRAFRRLSLARHMGVLSIAAVTVAANAYWLVVAFQFWEYIRDSGRCFQSGLAYLFTDYFGLIGADPLVSGVLSNRTVFRFLCIGSAVSGLFVWRRARDDRFLPLMLAALTSFGVAYLGSYFWLTKQIQPHRFVLPAMFLTVVPAAAFIVDTARSGALRRLPIIAYAALGLLALVAIPAFARDVLYYFPAQLPSLSPLHEVMPVMTGHYKRTPIPGLGAHKQMELRHRSHFQDMDDLARFLNEQDDGQGRVLVEWHVLAEHLAWRTRTQILGGFQRNEQHTSANLFYRDPEGLLPAAELKRYFEDYAVKWVIFTYKRRLEARRDILEPLGGIRPFDEMGVPRHRVYRTKIDVGYFAEGSGRVEVDYNRLDVIDTDPGADVVLRFHYLDTLVCEPGCALAREPQEGDPVGFIRVPAPHPAAFAIVNRYGEAP